VFRKDKLFQQPKKNVLLVPRGEKAIQIVSGCDLVLKKKFLGVIFSCHYIMPVTMRYHDVIEWEINQCKSREFKLMVYD